MIENRESNLKKIVVIGGGNMGFTYAEGIFNAQIAEIDIIERHQPRVEELKAMNKMAVTDSYEIIKTADIVFLAVKPQIAPAVFNEIKNLVNQDQLFISVMAGMKIKTIQNGLGVSKVIRCMPNLPASIQLGATTYTASKEVNDQEKELTEQILASTGIAFDVPTEEAIDHTTGISGSGSAYIFYFMNAMVKAGEELGFSPAESKSLVAQTFKGAVQLYEDNEVGLEEWMNRVASKGGTTRAALDSFDSNKIDALIKEGVNACVSRAKELGAQN